MVETRALRLAGLVELRLARSQDERGFFSETWRDEWLDELGADERFVQANRSCSTAAGTLRGLHFQVGPAAQAKLVRVTSGRIFDVAVDLRPGSPTFGQWDSIELSRQAGNALYLPRGFAHGFLTLEADCDVDYLASTYYAPEHERTLAFDDPDVAVAWPDVGQPLTISAKDRAGTRLSALAGNG